MFSPADGIITSIDIIDENHIKYIIKPRPILDSQVQLIPLTGKVCNINSGHFYKNTIIKTMLGEVEIRQECFSKLLNLFYYDNSHIINFFEYNINNKMVTSGRPLGLIPLPFYLLNSAEFSIILPLKAAERGCLSSNNKYKNQLSFHNKVSVGDLVQAGETIIGAYLIGSFNK